MKMYCQLYRVWSGGFRGGRAGCVPQPLGPTDPVTPDKWQRYCFVKVAGFLETQRAQWQRGPQKFPIISRPTPRLLSFALCLEWINDIYNTPDTGCLECYRPQASVNATTPGIDRKHIHCRNMLEIRIRYNYALKIVNKRRRNFLNKIQNVFINGKQVKIDKISHIG